MAVQQAEERSRRHPVRQGLIGGTLSTLGTLLLWMIAALIISIVVEWTGMALGWWEADGASHARAMRDQERMWLHSDVKQSVVTRDPVQFVDRISGQLTQLLFERTGFNAMLMSVAEAHPEEHSTVTTVRAAVAPIYEYLVAMVHITEVFGLRLAILALAMPLFGI
ncbi:MAG: DUF4400 domain-containing protein, partial [Gammaproteobacteria bacterium]|nr:DUF4400 domain-containing protein [Gammaproteobacteria bacterium]